MLAPGFHEGFIGALHDALRADIDPGSGGHLAVHHQALAIQFVEMIPGGPVRHQVGIGDQDAGCVGMGADHGAGFARLHDQGFVGFKLPEAVADQIEVAPGARGAADAAIDHQFMRVFGHVRVQVVHQHPQRGFGLPVFGGQLGASGREDVALVLAGVGHVRSPVRARSDKACSMSESVVRRRAARVWA